MGEPFFTPGLVFGNEESCALGSEDLVIDNDIFRHEYTHAMMDWCGFGDQFGGPMHYYGRSMGEGNADWFGYLYSKDPEVADVGWYWSTDGYLRDLDNTRMYPYDVDHPSLGLPEEHYTGEIWGGYLYDLSQALKSKALPYVYESFYYFSTSEGHMDGYPGFLRCDLGPIPGRMGPDRKRNKHAQGMGLFYQSRDQRAVASFLFFNQLFSLGRLRGGRRILLLLDVPPEENNEHPGQPPDDRGLA